MLIVRAPPLGDRRVAFTVAARANGGRAQAAGSHVLQSRSVSAAKVAKATESGAGPLVPNDERAQAYLEQRAGLMGGASRARTLILWMAFVASFTLVYGLFRGERVAYWPVYAAVVPVAIGWALWARRRALASAAENSRLADMGRLDEVAARQEAIAQRATSRLFRRLAVADLGYYELRRGNIDRALGIASAVFRNAPDSKLGRFLRSSSSGELATAYAARGDVEAALAWLPWPAFPAYDTPAAAANVYARAGEWERVLDLEWPSLAPAVVHGARHERRTFHLMRAFARDRLGRSDIDRFNDELEAARPVYAGEYDYLTAEWPELRAFVAECCLDPRGAPDAEGLPSARTVTRSPS